MLVGSSSFAFSLRCLVMCLHKFLEIEKATPPINVADDIVL